MRGISKISHNAPRQICGVGYVVLSRAQPADSYISSCFRNNTLTIITETQEIVPNCIVAKNAWQYLQFPQTFEARGSAVIWVNVPHQNKVIVLDVLHKRDELNPIQTTNQFKLERQVDDNIVTITGDGNTGTIHIISQGDTSSEGEIYIKALNSSELALFDIYVQGVMNVRVEKDLNLTIGNSLNILVTNPENKGIQAILNYILGTGLQFTDEFKNNIFSKNSGLYQEVGASNKVYARASGAISEPGLLGNKTYALFNEMKNLLNNMITTLQSASAGPNVSGPIVNAAVSGWLASVTAMQNEISLIKAKNFELS